MTLRAALLGDRLAPRSWRRRTASTAYIVGFVQDTTCTPAQAFVSPSPDASSDAVSDAQGRFALALSGERPRADVTAHLRRFSHLHPNGGAGRDWRSRRAHTYTRSFRAGGRRPGHRDRGSHGHVVPPTDGKLRGEILTIVVHAVEGRAGRGDAAGPTRSSSAPTANGRFAFGDPPREVRAARFALKATSRCVRNGTTVAHGETPHVARAVGARRGRRAGSDLVIRCSMTDERRGR